MLAVVAPTTRMQISAMMVIALVKQFSVSCGEERSFSEKLGDN
jgi:hypothetical protein